MATRIPLYYCKTLVGFARLDDDLPRISPTIVWSVDVDTRTRKAANRDKALIAAILQNDPTVVQRATPYTWLVRGLRVDLVSLALRPAVIEYVNTPVKDHNTVFEALAIIRAIGPFSYRDNDHTNLTRENLREFTPASGWELPPLDHPTTP